MHLRSLVLLLMFLPIGARRSIRIDDSHHGAQQQNNMFANKLEVSAESGDALIPGGSGKGSFRRAPDAGVPSVRGTMPLMAARDGLKLDPARQKLVKAGLPVKFASRVSYQTGGQKQTGQEDEIIILWKEFQKCYPTREKALEVLSKNTLVILPQFSSPRKIRGTYALLQKRFGKSAAQDIVEKNPGVLAITPETVGKTSDEQIMDAANLADMLETNKDVFKAINTAVRVGFIGAIAYGISQNNPDWWETIRGASTGQ